MTSRAALVAALLCLVGVGCHGRHVELLIEDSGDASGCNGVCPPVFDLTCGNALLPTFGGGCTPIGVAACGAGFDTDGQGGCTARLASACTGAGEMAIPGEKCRKPTACDTSVDRFGGLPAGHRVIYVDASSGASSPDGSLTSPFAKIADAQAAVSSAGDDIIALLPGSYFGDVARGDGQLWGACDGLVEIVGTSASGAALHLSSEQEVHHVAVRGPGRGVETENGAVFQGVWVHGTGGEGISFASPSFSAITITDSLVEDTVGAGIHCKVAGGDSSFFTMTRSIVRSARADSVSKAGGQGVWIENVIPSTTLTATIDASIFDDNTSAGLDVNAVQLKLTGSLVRGTLPLAGVLDSGYGLHVVGAIVTVTGTVFTGNASASIYTVGATEVDLEGDVVRDTVPDPTTGFGIGVRVASGHLRLADCLVVGSYGTGVLLEGAPGDVISSVVSGTHAFGTAGSLGLGVRAAYDDTGHASTLTMRNSVVVGSAGGGVVLVGATAEITDCAIRATSLVTAANLGNGLILSTKTGGSTTRSLATVTRTLVDRSACAGIQIFGSSLAFDASLVAGCSGGAVLVGAESGSGSDFTAHDGSACGCSGTYEACTAGPSSLSP